jgi:4'-phosphopantetheinyl transferase
LRFERRRSEWLLGRWAAKQLLSRVVGGPLQAFSIENSLTGVPQVQLAGKLLPGCLSISHRADQALVAWTQSSQGQLGVDLECVEAHSLAFVSDYFTPAEQSLIAVAEQKDLVSSCFWSVKEAMLKALQTGLRLDTRAVEILALPEFEGDDWIRLPVCGPLKQGLIWQAWTRREGQKIFSAAWLGAALEEISWRRWTTD